MQVLLIERLNRRGIPGDVIDVKMGYGKYLLSKGIALYPTDLNMKKVQADMEKIQARISERLDRMSALAEKISALDMIVFQRNANASGNLYGSVSPKDIVDILAEQKIFIDANHVKRTDIIRLGEHIVQISCGDYIGNFKILVERLGEQEAEVDKSDFAGFSESEEDDR